MRVGFDFDKVLIDYPPLAPSFLIDFFYKNHTNSKSLSYRIPGKFEQKIRVMSHHPIFRHPILENVNSVKNISAKKGMETFLISSRFGFLKNRTEEVLIRSGLDKTFKEVYFNFNNKQPHLFKKEIIKQLKIDKYIDDDYDLLEYLTKECPITEFYWLSGSKKNNKKHTRIITINSIEEFRNKYL